MTIQDQAIELLLCAAGGSFPSDETSEESIQAVDFPSLLLAATDLDIIGRLGEESPVLAFAFKAMLMADGGTFGESFRYLYDDDDSEGLRHSLLEAAQLIVEGKVMP